MVSVRSMSVVVGVVALSDATSLAAAIAPPAWVQASANPLATAAAEFRTYPQWDVFTSTTGPNAPARANFTWNGVSYAADLNPSKGIDTPTFAANGAAVRTLAGYSLNAVPVGAAAVDKTVLFPLPVFRGRAREGVCRRRVAFARRRPPSLILPRNTGSGDRPGVPHGPPG